MATEKILNTRIQLKYDTLANWNASTFKLKAGELAIVSLGENKDGSVAGSVNQHPVLFKVGTGNHTFAELPYASALAADVYAWAKAADIRLEGKILKFVDAAGTAIKSVEFNYVTQTEVEDILKNYPTTEAMNTAISSAVNALDSEATQQAGADGLALTVTQVDGKITAILGSIAAEIYDAHGAAATAEGNAKSYTNTEVKKVQDEFDALETYIGTIPETAEATNIVAYVQEKTAGIATDTALEELTGRIKSAEDAISEIEDDYLKAADKTELQGEISAVQTAVDTEKSRAEGIEAGLRSDVNAIKGDYVKTADKEALQGSIDTVSGKVTTLVGEDVNKSVRTIANEELAKQLIAEGAAESLDTLAEIAAWIQSHPDDAAAMNKAIDDLEVLVGALPEGVTATTVVGYIQELVAAEKSRAEGIESGLNTRLEAVEAKFGNGEGNVEAQIATAKQEAINTAAADAKTKADAAEKNAKDYADGLAGNYATAAQGALANTAVQPDTLKSYYTKTEADTAFMDSTETNNAIDTKITALNLGTTYEPIGAETRAKEYADGLADNYATSGQGALADTALQGVVAGTGLKVSEKDVSTKKQTIEIDDSVVFVFDCGSATKNIENATV